MSALPSFCMTETDTVRQSMASDDIRQLDYTASEQIQVLPAERAAEVLFSIALKSVRTSSDPKAEAERAQWAAEHLYILKYGISTTHTPKAAALLQNYIDDHRAQIEREITEQS